MEHNHPNQRDHDHEHTHEDEEKDLLGQLRHYFKPHSHDSTDSIDNALKGSNEGIRTVKVSLFGLGLTALIQLVIALMSGSVALLADTVHNFADATTAIPLYFAFSLGKKPANKKYTYGFGRAEDLAGIFIVGLLILSTTFALWQSVSKLFNPQPITHLLFVALGSIIGFLGNELVAHYRIRTGQKIGSNTLIADGYHARTDGLASLSVLFAAIGTYFGFHLADPIIGILVNIIIFFTIKELAKQVWYRLMDAVDPELMHAMEHAALDTQGVEMISNIKLRWIGHNLHAEAAVIVDCELPISKAHDISEEAEHNILHAIPKLSNMTVHIDPCSHNGQKIHQKTAHHYSSYNN